MMSKAQMIELLRKHNASCVPTLESPDVSEQDFVFAMYRNKLRVGEGFFRELAKRLGLPYVEAEQLEYRQDLATVLPYSVLTEHLTIPLEVSKEKASIATANPLNREFFSLIKSILKVRKLKIYVTSIENIIATVENGYNKIHDYRALKELYYRSPEDSAHKVLYPWQRNTVIGLSLLTFLLFIVSYPASFIFIFSVINIIYFIVNPIKFYVSFRGFRGSRRSVRVSSDEVKALDETTLPTYTILVPIYREAKVLPHILKNIYKMDYPKNKLDVKILMEENDEETIGEARRLGLFGEPEELIESMTPEEYKEFLKTFDAVIVPDAPIKTKPRACNFGLLRAKGEYCVIYDAEDDPEPDQLKKAVIAFSRLGEDYVCLQSRLNFYNPKENLLTRWFSLEYSFWYDYYLEGLDYVGAPLPLGGTSNHFRTSALRKLGGWDPYNVTEDADLGVRISKRKMSTAMLNSYTFEEANSKLWNWIRQRSRWNKGYIQTYLVHMRHPRKLVKELGWKGFFFFQLTFGGNIFLPLVNPLLWAVTLSTILFPGAFQFLFYYPLVYICIVNLVIGNTVYILLHLGPYVLKKNYTSIPLALIIPVYWVLISVGAWKGTIQLIRKPFYWEKTDHGIKVEQPKGTITNEKRNDLVGKEVIENAMKLGIVTEITRSPEGALILIVKNSSIDEISIALSRVKKVGDVILIRPFETITTRKTIQTPQYCYQHRTPRDSRKLQASPTS